MNGHHFGLNWPLTEEWWVAVRETDATDGRPEVSETDWATYATDICRLGREMLGFAADAVQAELLESHSRRTILNCTRQWGKSSVTALKAVHTALFTEGATVIVMSPSKRQSGEFLLKVKTYLKKLDDATRGRQGKFKNDTVNELSVLLRNGSRVIALPGMEATTRGFSAVDLLIIDEAARVCDQQYYAAGPMLAVKGGAMWLLSTPFGARGFFWKEWELGGEEWKRVAVKAVDCARIEAKHLEGERKRLSADWFRQEYGCEFVGCEGQVFRDELLEEAMVSGLGRLFQ